jgi:hypothetical protein
MVMADELSIRNALIELRNFLEEEPERKDRIEALSRELGELIADRRQKADSLIAMWIRLFGFEHDEAKAFVDGVEPAKAPVDPPKKERRSSKKKRKKRKKRNSVKKSTVAIPARAKGYPNEIDETIPLAELESRFVDLLKQRWPRCVCLLEDHWLPVDRSARELEDLHPPLLFFRRKIDELCPAVGADWSVALSAADLNLVTLGRRTNVETSGCHSMVTASVAIGGKPVNVVCCCQEERHGRPEWL